MITDKSLKVGALLYTPALTTELAEHLKLRNVGKYSQAICLEDTTSDGDVFVAVNQVAHALEKIKRLDIVVPDLYVRVRNPDNLTYVHTQIKNYYGIVKGYILPKYSHLNAKEYNSAVKSVVDVYPEIQIMPILESGCIIAAPNRMKALMNIADCIHNIEANVLNVRVGGNDFCKYFSVRRNVNYTIWDIHPVANVLSDIITVFGNNYIVSGPVFEYFGGDLKWKDTLAKEIELDRLNGFTGKTLIHPEQLPIANKAFKVTEEDFVDTTDIMNWDKEMLVAKSRKGWRMNESLTHGSWAIRTLALADAFGVVGQSKNNTEVTE